MKKPITVLLIILLTSTLNQLVADEKYPNEIVSVSFAQAFFDGGSISVVFTDESGKEWKLFYDRRLNAKKKDYDSISLGPVSDDETSLSPIVRQGKKKEEQLLEMIERYFKNLKPSETDEYIFLKQLLEKKNIIPNQAAHTTSASARRVA
ncbi:hypothetical protein [Pelagicoccus mobilis]|uniref:Uncharacterized protein n=1 Tax=Pelagicoccus mobilis TaxID=415221 RepID=A0A934S7C9_9BACT|nr:hypothetical protein [Pelagicoccus mobilis]MBK1880704.1 hypothetical protein [Pelagicoccus mobilis]